MASNDQTTNTPAQPQRGEPRRRGAQRDGFRLGRFFGVELVADWSLLIIFTLILVNLGAGLFPFWHPEWGPLLNWTMAFAASVLFFASVAVHELSHALVARANDIPVRRITLFVFGGMAHMEREPPSPKSELLMAAVGPLTSLAIGVLATLAGSALVAGPIEQYAADPEGMVRSMGPVATLLLWLGPINVLLGLFNLVPGFPLDGGRVLRSLLWWGTGDLERATRWASLVGRGFAWLLMGAGVSMILGVRIPLLGSGLLPGLWLLLIGWFLNNAARASYQQLLVHNALEDVLVADVMRPSAEVVPPELPVDQLVRDYFLASDTQAFPVVGAGGELFGLVELGQVRGVPRGQWAETRVGDIMKPATELHVATPDEDMAHVLPYLADQEQVPVVDHGVVAGVLRRQDLMRWLALRADLIPG